MANRDIVAIGTSAGGFEALCFLANEFERKAAVLRDAIGRLDRAERSEFEPPRV
jgi:hypothetical protein